MSDKDKFKDKFTVIDNKIAKKDDPYRLRFDYRIYAGLMDFRKSLVLNPAYLTREIPELDDVLYYLNNFLLKLETENSKKNIFFFDPEQE